MVNNNETPVSLWWQAMQIMRLYLSLLLRWGLMVSNNLIYLYIVLLFLSYFLHSFYVVLEMKAFVNCWKANNIQLFPVEYLLFYSFSVFYLLYLTTMGFDKYLQFNVYYFFLHYLLLQYNVCVCTIITFHRASEYISTFLFRYLNNASLYNYKKHDPALWFSSFEKSIIL
jgi:hypothetical protein